MSSNYGFQPTLSGLNTIESDSTTSSNIICDTIQINTSGTAPTMPTADNSTHIATTEFVQAHTSGSYVTLNTTQSISGQKTFTNANTYFSGNLKATAVSTNYIDMDDGTANEYMNLYSKNMNLNTTQSIGFIAGGYTSFISPSNVYFNNTTGTTKLLQINDTTNQALELQTSPSTNVIRSYNNLSIPITGNISINPTISLNVSVGNTGNIDLGTGSSFTGNINIGRVGAVTSIPAITGKYIDLFAGQFRMFSASGGGASIYTYVPPSGRTIVDYSSTNCDMVGQVNLTSNNITCSVAPTTGDEYCNKTYVDSAVTGGLTNYVTTNTTQTITGEKTFSNANTYITGNLVNDTIRSSATGTALSIGNNQIAGALNIGTNSTRNSSSSINLGNQASPATTNINGAIINVNAGSNININSSATGGNYNIATTGSTTGSVNIATNQTTGALNIATNSTRTSGTITIGSASSTANMNINCGGTLTVNANASFTNIPNCSVVPSSANNLTNKTYVDSAVTGATSGLLTSNNTWSGSNTFNGTFSVNQVLPSNMEFTVAAHTDNYYFNFVGAPSTIGSLRMHFVNALGKYRISQEISGKSLAIGLGATDYIVCNPTTTYCDIPKLSTGFVDYTLNTINARSGYSLSLSLNGTNMITLDNTTSKVLLAPTRCSSYLEVVGEIQANNPIELNYNPSSLSAGRLGYQYYSTSTTTPTTNASKNVTFSGTGLDYFTLPVGVWLCELYSGWAQTSNNRAISLSGTSATTDNSRACYSTQQNSSYQELTFTTTLSVTDSSFRYYFVISNGANTGSYSSVQHYLRITRIA
jgi:hypothetical protein